MRVLLSSPFLPPFFDGRLTERGTILEIVKTSGDLQWCEDFVAVRLNGVTIPRKQWRNVTVKPEAGGCLELCVVPQKGSLLPIVASVALVALTAGIGTFGIPAIGIAASSFASGAVGAGTATSDSGIAELFALHPL